MAPVDSEIYSPIVWCLAGSVFLALNIFEQSVGLGPAEILIDAALGF
jgi:hypothetical protein